MEHIKVLGCLVHVLLLPQERHKLQEKTRNNCSFVGYQSHSKEYRVYDHDNKIIMQCRDVYFLENPTVNPRVDHGWWISMRSLGIRMFKRVGGPTWLMLEM